MAEETRIMVPLNDAKGVEQARIYSTTGEKQPKAAFEAALNAYNAGKPTPGFTVLEPGMMNTARTLFEMVNQPVQNAAKAVDQWINQSVGRQANQIRSTLGMAPQPTPEVPVAETVASQ